MAASDQRVIVAVFGPTSSGKTRLSIELGLRLRDALARDPVVISADSRQVYRYLDIGTSKTTAAEMRGIRHEMIDVADPVRKLELDQYVAAAREHLGTALANGQLPMIVGGTGVYVKSLVEGWAVDDTAATRAALAKDFPPSMSADAHATLERLDRQLARRIHPNNHAAVLNSLAAIMAGREASRPAPARTVVLGLDPGRAEVEDAVARTFDRQLRLGLVDEITALAQRYDLDEQARRLGKASPNQVLHTHGYSEFWDVALDRSKRVADLTAAELDKVRSRVIERIRRHTHRQRTFFRKLPSVRMVRTPEQAARLVLRDLRVR